MSVLWWGRKRAPHTDPALFGSSKMYKKQAQSEMRDNMIIIHPSLKKNLCLTLKCETSQEVAVDFRIS